MEKLKNQNAHVNSSILCDAFQNIEKASREEMVKQQFIFVPIEKAKRFEKDNLFGPKVDAAFPSCRAEIKAAGTCLALEQHTAAIFHLMRCAEVGLNILAKRLRIRQIDGKPLKEAVWGKIIDEIDNRLASVAKPKKNIWEKEVSAEFREIKDLWRNPISHNLTQYDEWEATHAFNHTEILMQRLAKKLKER